MNREVDEQLVSVQSYLEKFCSLYAENAVMKRRVGDAMLTHTFAELRHDSLTLANGLVAQNLSGKHLAILSENRYEFLVAFFGCLLAGTVFVPINIAEKDKIPSMLAFADVDAVLLTAMTAPYLPLIQKTCPRVTRFFSFDATEGCEPLPASENRGGAYYGSFSDNRTALLCFTSGTSSGKPKCVMLTAANLFAAARHRVYRFGRLPDGRLNGICMYSPLPMFHLASLICTAVTTSIPTGSVFATSTVISSSFRDIVAFQPDYIITVPALAKVMCDTMWQTGALQNDSFSEESFGSMTMDDLRARRRKYNEAVATCSKNLQLVNLCGAKTSDELEIRLTALGIYVSCSYGLTECSPEVTLGVPHFPKRVGDNGEPCSYNETKIVDDVLYVRGENVMKGYYKNPEATAEVLSPEGWLCTGDFAETDGEGCLYIRGRATSVIVLSNGDNIDTDELSGVFTAHPSIAEIVILPDKKNNNDALVALIYPAAENVAEAVAEINRTLPLQKRIVRFRLTDAPFEKNEMMKIKRFRYQNETV